MALEPEEIRELFALAKAHQVVLVEKLTMVYLRAFTQLVWLTHGALVGDVVAVKCAISQDDFEGGKISAKQSARRCVHASSFSVRITWR